MNREKLMQNPLPIDRMAARVTGAAKPENLWRPMPKKGSQIPEPGSVLRTAPIPHSAPRELLNLTGKRRGQMVILGYAAEQGHSNSARWVARCDCGNYEYRTRIMRWLGTDSDDFCHECQKRRFLLRSGKLIWPEKAKRKTIDDAGKTLSA